MTDTERWIIGLAITALTSLLGFLWFLGMKAWDAYNVRQSKEFTTIEGRITQLSDRLEGKYVSSELFQIRMGQQDKEIARVSDDVRDGFAGLKEALASKVSKDTWRAVTRSEPDSDSPPPPRPRLPSRPGGR